jgi:hypothetical protein
MSQNLENYDCRYFISYTGVKLPFKLVNPLEIEALENRNTYFKAYYDAQDRLIQFQKLVYGEVELAHSYEYYAGEMLRQAEITDADGEVTVLLFSETGELLEGS